MNPTGQPFQSPYGAPPQRSAQQDLNVPSILLMVLGGITLVSNLGSAAVQALTSGGRDSLAQFEDLMRQAGMSEQARSVASSLSSGPLSMVLMLVGVLLAAAMVFGAWQMRQLTMYPAALASCVIALLPCGSCCCVFSMPVGVWALVVLLRPEVRAQFR